MKKIITLVFALGALTSVFAQSGRYDNRDEARDVIVGRPYDRGYNGYDQHNGNYGYNSREKDRQIEQVYMEFNRRMEAVQRDRFLRGYERQREIRQLEAQRDQRIREINYRFGDQHTSYYDRRNDRRW